MYDDVERVSRFPDSEFKNQMTKSYLAIMVFHWIQHIVAPTGPMSRHRSSEVLHRDCATLRMMKALGEAFAVRKTGTVQSTPDQNRYDFIIEIRIDCELTRQYRLLGLTIHSSRNAANLDRVFLFVPNVVNTLMF